MMRHRDATFDTATKNRSQQLLAKKIGVKAPSVAFEENDPAAADAFYVRCGAWLRENTRDTKKFKILFQRTLPTGFGGHRRRVPSAPLVPITHRRWK
jgi:hypothetical protein